MDSTIISPKQYQNYLVQDVNFNALNDYEFLLSIQVHVKDFNQWKQELVRYYPLLEQHDIKPICLLTTESSSEDVFMLLGCNNLIEVNNYTKKLLKTNIKDRAGILSFYNQNIYKRI